MREHFILLKSFEDSLWNKFKSHGKGKTGIDQSWRDNSFASTLGWRPVLFLLSLLGIGIKNSYWCNGESFAKSSCCYFLILVCLRGFCSPAFSVSLDMTLVHIFLHPLSALFFLVNNIPFSRGFHPKRHSHAGIHFLHMGQLESNPRPLALQAPCSTEWACIAVWLNQH